MDMFQAHVVVLCAIFVAAMLRQNQLVSVRTLDVLVLAAIPLVDVKLLRDWLDPDGRAAAIVLTYLAIRMLFLSRSKQGAFQRPVRPLIDREYVPWLLGAALFIRTVSVVAYGKITDIGYASYLGARHLM